MSQWIIEGVVTSISSVNGGELRFTVCGSENYCLKRKGQEFNVFWQCKSPGLGKSLEAEATTETQIQTHNLKEVFCIAPFLNPLIINLFQSRARALFLVSMEENGIIVEKIVNPENSRA